MIRNKLFIIRQWKKARRGKIIPPKEIYKRGEWSSNIWKGSYYQILTQKDVRCLSHLLNVLVFVIPLDSTSWIFWSLVKWDQHAMCCSHRNGNAHFSWNWWKLSFRGTRKRGRPLKTLKWSRENIWWIVEVLKTWLQIRLSRNKRAHKAQPQ